MELEIENIKKTISQLNEAKTSLVDAHLTIPCGAPHLEKVERVLDRIEMSITDLEYVLDRNYPNE
jgi:hypothetical protein